MTARMTEERFWGKVDIKGDSECWEWKGCVLQDKRTKTKPYGATCTYIEGVRVTKAHRLAYIYAYAFIPDGAQVLHSCDNPPCCNPMHLYLGSHEVNHNEKVAKKRHVWHTGSGHGMAKLTENDVLRIRELLDMGVTQTRLAKDFGIDQTGISRIKLRKNWNHI